MKKISFAAVLAATTFGLGGYALACSGCGCSLNTDDVTQGGGSGWHIDERFDYIDQNRLQIGGNRVGAQDPTTGTEVQKYTLSVFYTTTIDYEAEGPWGINLAIPVQYRIHSTLNNSDWTPVKSNWNDLSDIRLIGRYTGLTDAKDIGLQFGMKFPTGRTTEAFTSGNSAQIGNGVDRGLQPGTGTWDALLGFYKNGQITETLHWFTTAQWQKPLTEYNDFAEGQKLTGTIGVRYVFNQYLTPQLQVNVQNRWRDHGGQADRANSGGEVINLSPGLFVNIREDTSIYGFIQVPIYQRVGGLELVPDYTASLGVKYKF